MSYPTPFLGTIISSPIRPSGPSDSIATAFSNEIKGGHHAYETISERDSIVEDRRDWNMLVTVYNDVSPDNNKTYQLFYNHYSTNLTDNQNWVTYNPLGLRVPTEWVDSVLSITNSNPISGLTDGDRFLVSSGAVGLFATYDNMIAQYDSTKSPIPWMFYTPTNGMSLRIDNQKNILYKYSGTYSSGSWTYEYLNQVRYITATSSNGLTYSANSAQTSIDTYNNSVFYVNFGMTNSGNSTLNIDSLGDVQIKKLAGTNLSSLSANDLVLGNTYQLIYNNGIFQTTIVSDTAVIGPAEDGDYTDGLYTDFTTSTPIGTAVDRFNEVLKALVPPSAPDLSSWSSDITGVSGKLSFNGTTNVSGQTFSSATQSTISPTDIGGDFNPSGYRIGIISLSGADLTGRLNSGISTAGPGSPTPAYATFSFGNAMTGTMSLLLNGQVISSISLTSTSSAIDGTSAGATSGISVSAATSSFFPSGFAFPTFMNRTGTWRVKRSLLTDGYNYIVVRHNVTPSQSFVLSRYEVVLDSSTAATSIGSPTVNLVPGSTKALSGLYFYTSYQLQYSVAIDNVYRNTYNAVATFTDSTGTFTSPSLTAPTPTSPADQFVITSQTFSLASNKRRYFEPVSPSVTVTRTLTTQPSTAGGYNPVTFLYIDNVTSAVTLDTTEDFVGKARRLKQDTSGTKYPSNYFRYVTDITGGSNTWDSTLTIASGTNGTGLQIVKGSLVYPSSTNHSAFGNSTTNPNFGLRDYSGVSTITNGLGNTSYRTYTRYFRVSTAKAIIQFACSGTSFAIVSSSSALSGNNIWFEVKLPYDNGGNPALPSGFSAQSDGSVTGWMDVSQNFTAGQYGNGAGCYYLGSLSGTFQINLGLANTTLSSGYVMVRITAPNSWIGSITGITVTTP